MAGAICLPRLGATIMVCLWLKRLVAIYLSAIVSGTSWLPADACMVPVSWRDVANCRAAKRAMGCGSLDALGRPAHAVISDRSRLSQSPGPGASVSTVLLVPPCRRAVTAPSDS
jgi:hypothetical protein